VSEVERFRRWADNVSDPDRGESVSVPAATVIIIRDARDGIETLMLRRDSKLAFAGGMWVFPGGRVDDEDRAQATDSSRDEPDEIEVARVAAVREAFEESGLRLDETWLVPFSHWEPPPIAPKRFSTWFFLAPAPESSDEITIDDGEIREHLWLRPTEALGRREAGEIELAPPTWVTLRELSLHDSVDDALAAAAERTPEHFATKVAFVEHGVIALWHGDTAYEDGDTTRPGTRHRLAMLESGWRYERS
jgi:8-oxo-dGTP pyrophosphatase MutT (NUDIX family)